MKLILCMQDLWNLGRVLGLENFSGDHDELAKQMDRELNAANRKERNARKKANSDQAETVVRGVLKGDDTRVDVKSDYKDTLLKWIRKLREWYAGCVIRRTVKSIDNEGKRISGLDPYSEHPLVVDLYDWEMDNLDELGEELVKNNAARAARFASGQVSVDCVMLYVLDGGSLSRRRGARIQCACSVVQDGHHTDYDNSC